MRCNIVHESCPVCSREALRELHADGSLTCQVPGSAERATGTGADRSIALLLLILWEASLSYLTRIRFPSLAVIGISRA